MPLTFNLRAERTTPDQHAKGNFGTGSIELLLDGTVIAKLNNFSVRWSQQQQKWYIKPPARSVDSVNPQTGQPQKQWFDQWEFFPGDRQVHDGWGGAFLQEFFKQIPDPQVPKQPVAVAPAAAPTYGGPPGTYGAPAGGPPMPGPGGYPAAAPAAAPAQAYAPHAGPPAAPPPAAPPAAPAAPVAAPPATPTYGPPGVPAAPGAPPMPSPGAPAFAPQPRPPAGPAGPTAHMPASPSFPLPG